MCCLDENHNISATIIYENKMTFQGGTAILQQANDNNRNCEAQKCTNVDPAEILRYVVSACQGLESPPYSWMMASVSILEVAKETLTAMDLLGGE